MLYWIRQHFWSIHLAAFVIAGCLMAQTFSYASQLWRPLPGPRDVLSQTGTTTKAQPTKKRSLLGQHNIFRPGQIVALPQSQVEAKTSEKPKPVYVLCDPKATYRPSHLGLMLKGTTVAEDQDYSTAAVYDPKRRETVVLRSGDTYKGIRICGVNAGYVKIDRGNGHFERLAMSDQPWFNYKRYKRVKRMYRSRVKRLRRQLRDIRLHARKLKRKSPRDYRRSKAFANLLHRYRRIYRQYLQAYRAQRRFNNS